MSATINDILDFLLQKFVELEYNYKRIENCRASLRTLFEARSDNILDSPIFERFFKAAFNINPPVRRKVITWNIDKVLDHLERLPKPQSLSKIQLGSKLALLILLATGAHVNEIFGMNLDTIEFLPDGFKFSISHMAKAFAVSNSSKDLLSFQVKSNPRNPKLCPLIHLEAYIDRTKNLRTTWFLFTSAIPPYSRLGREWLGKWVKILIVESGANTSERIQSTRSRVASALLAKGVRVDEIMKQCNWVTAHAFYKHYQWRIQDFPQGGAPTPKSAIIFQFFPKTA